MRNGNLRIEPVKSALPERQTTSIDDAIRTHLSDMVDILLPVLCFLKESITENIFLFYYPFTHAQSIGTEICLKVEPIEKSTYAVFSFRRELLVENQTTYFTLLKEHPGSYTEEILPEYFEIKYSKGLVEYSDSRERFSSLKIDSKLSTEFYLALELFNSFKKAFCG